MDLNAVFSNALRDYIALFTNPLQLRIVQLEQALESQGRLLDGALGEIRMLRDRPEGQAIERASVHELAGFLTDAQLRTIARNIPLPDLLECVDWSEVLDYSEIVSGIDMSELAGEFDLDSIAEHIDLESAISEFFSENSVKLSI
ncbi:MAG: hypothetical protein EBT13_04285 [Rhodobacteraceae bacterium]|jgi:hypothetical protein|nr:hypothetical protein [Paracoccaceae bacterium]